MSFCVPVFVWIYIPKVSHLGFKYHFSDGLGCWVRFRVSFFVKYVHKHFAHFYWVFGLLDSCKLSFTLCEIYSYSPHLHLKFLMFFFPSKRMLIFMKYNIQIILFYGFYFLCTPKKILLLPKSLFFSIFYSRNLYNFLAAFRSMIHFNWIFVHDVKSRVEVYSFPKEYPIVPLNFVGCLCQKPDHMLWGSVSGQSVLLCWSTYLSLWHHTLLL